MSPTPSGSLGGLVDPSLGKVFSFEFHIQKNCTQIAAGAATSIVFFCTKVPSPIFVIVLLRELSTTKLENLPE